MIGSGHTVGLSIPVVLILAATQCSLTAGGAESARILPQGYTYSHHEWLAPEWGDASGTTLIDGQAGGGAGRVIFKGAMNIDFKFSGRFRIEKVVVHAFRGNQWYLLDAVQVFARQQENYIKIGENTEGYRGPIASTVYVYEFGGLDVVTDSVRVRMLTPNHTGLREVEFFGRPAGAAVQGAATASVPLTATGELVAREGNLDGSGSSKVLLENRFAQLLVDPQRGGIIESVIHKAGNRQLTATIPDAPKFPGGLLEDHNWNPYYSYAQFPFDADLRVFPDRAVLVLRGTGRQEMYGFTQVVKTLVLHQDRASLDVTYEYRNDASSMTEFEYSWWVHNLLRVAGEKNTFYVPSTRGVRQFAWEEDPERHPCDDWVYNVSRGWAGVLGESGTGVATETELRLLHCFYTWYGRRIASLEWRLATLPVKPGESLQTPVRFLFLRGLSGLSGAADGFAAHVAAPTSVVPDEPATFTVELFSDRARPARIELSVCRMSGGETRSVGNAQAELAAGEASSWSWQAALAAGTYRLLLTVNSGGSHVVFERGLTVGKPDVPYTQPPDVERLGGGATAGGSELGALPRHDLALDVKTPHETWATPLPDGPIRAFILVDVQEQREIVELAQRLDLQAETVKIRSRLQGADYRYRGDRSITSLADAQERILGILLAQTFDVFVLCGMTWQGHFTDAIRGAIVEQVREGAGLLWIGPGGDEVAAAGGDALLPVQGVATRQWSVFRLPDAAVPNAVTAEQGLARLIPLAEQGPLLAYCHEQATGVVHLTARTIVGPRREVPLLITGQYGKGRTTVLAWDNHYNSGRPDVPGRLLPVFANHRTIRTADPSYRYWEDMFALLTRVVVWSAGRDSPTRLVSAAVETNDAVQLRVGVRGPRQGCRLQVSWQDEFGTEIERTESAVVERDDAVLSVPDTVPAGPAHAYLFLRDAQGCALDWGAIAFTMPGAVRLAAVEQDRRFIRHGEQAQAVAVVERSGEGGELWLDVRVSDGYGRELETRRTPAPMDASPARVELTFATQQALGGKLVVDLTLRDAVRVCVRRTLSFGLTRMQPARGPRLVVWDMTLGSKQKYVNSLEARRALDLGMDAVLDGYHRTETDAYRVTVEGGVQFHPLNCLSFRPAAYQQSKEAYNQDGDRKYLVRNPCLDDPQDQARLLAVFREHCAPQLAKGGSLDYCLGDEMSLTHYGDYFDYCFHPSTLAGFRDWLRTGYATLEALNAQWDTDYTSWDDIEPMTYKQAKAGGNPGRWCDFRTYMEISVARFLGLVQETLTQLDARSLISLSGTQYPVAGNGMDWWRMSQVVPLFHSYNTANMCQARRSFSPWQCEEPWFAGYWQVDPKLEWNMWWCLFHNCSGVSGWYTPIFFYPDMTFTTSGQQMRDHWRELKSGIWQQVRALAVEKPKVAVHYSQASIHMAFLQGRPKAVQDAWEGWLRSLEDIGIPYDFIAYEQLERGLLDQGQYKALILPCSSALSKAEVTAVQRFVRTGGLVLADVLPGVTDDHGKPVDPPALAALFGVSAAGPNFAGKAGLRLQDGTVVPRIRPAAALQLAGGAAAGRSVDSDVPVLIAATAGDGTSLLTNFELAFYVTERRLGQAPERRWRGLLLAALGKAGVQPGVSIVHEGDTLPHAEVVRYLDGQGRPVLIGVLNGLLPGMAERRVELTFHGVPAGRICAVRSQQMLGIAPTIATVLKPGEPKLFAVLPASAGGEAAAARMVTVQAGQSVNIPFAFAGLSMPQAVRYEVTDATGRSRPEYSGVIVAPAGQGEIMVPLAVNDPKGDWRVEFTHVLTGAEARATLRVE